MARNKVRRPFYNVEWRGNRHAGQNPSMWMPQETCKTGRSPHTFSVFIPYCYITIFSFLIFLVPLLYPLISLLFIPTLSSLTCPRNSPWRKLPSTSLTMTGNNRQRSWHHCLFRKEVTKKDVAWSVYLVKQAVTYLLSFFSRFFFLLVAGLSFMIKSMM